jgi:proline racemase
MFYVLVEATAHGFAIEPDEGSSMARLGDQIRGAAKEQIVVVHPHNPAIDLIENVLWHGPAKHPNNHGRNAVVMASGGFDPDRPETWRGCIDRSPCGTGTCALLAVRSAKGLSTHGEAFRHEGILDLVFTGRIESHTRVGELPAVVPSVEGQAWITGYANYVLQDDDPFPEGFSVTDIWSPVERPSDLDEELLQ